MAPAHWPAWAGLVCFGALLGLIDLRTGVVIEFQSEEIEKLQAEVARKHVGLGSLPGSRRAEQNEDPHRGPSCRPGAVLTG